MEKVENLKSLLDQGLTWVLNFLPDLLIAVVILIAGLWVIRIANKLIHRFFEKKDYDQGEKDHSYFYVCFYEPIKEAISRNVQRFYFGPANYETKMRRGCRIEPLFMNIKSTKVSTNLFLSKWFKVTEKWYRHKYRDLLIKAD